MTMLLFVYGTLRPGSGWPMARRLATEARYLGPARASGRLYAVANYPGFLPGEEGEVIGDLFALRDTATLDWLDTYEECTARHPLPHEYRRDTLWVAGSEGACRAWTYLYALPVGGLIPIEGGDFLACARPGGD